MPKQEWKVGDRFYFGGGRKGHNPKELMTIVEIKNPAPALGKGWDVLYTMDDTPRESYIGAIHSETLTEYHEKGWVSIVSPIMDIKRRNNARKNTD